MTSFNTDYNNTELLDQELSIQELAAATGGLVHAPTGPVMKVIGMGLKKVGDAFVKAIVNQPLPTTGPAPHLPTYL